MPGKQMKMYEEMLMELADEYPELEKEVDALNSAMSDMDMDEESDEPEMDMEEEDLDMDMEDDEMDMEDEDYE